MKTLMPYVKRATFKEKGFAREYVKANGNGKQAILNSPYKVSNEASAKAMAQQLLDKPRVQEEINIILKEMKLDPTSLAAISKKILKQGLKAKASFQSAVAHTEFLYKVQGITPVNKNMSLNVTKHENIANQDFAKLQEEVRKLSENMASLLT